MNVLSKYDWDHCFVNGTYQAFPNHDKKLYNTRGNGYQFLSTNVQGTYHLACGVGLNKTTGVGYHCENAGMKAKITVSEYCPKIW